MIFKKLIISLVVLLAGSAESFAQMPGLQSSCVCSVEQDALASLGNPINDDGSDSGAVYKATLRVIYLNNLTGRIETKDLGTFSLPPTPEKALNLCKETLAQTLVCQE